MDRLACHLNVCFCLGEYGAVYAWIREGVIPTCSTGSKDRQESSGLMNRQKLTAPIKSAEQPALEATTYRPKQKTGLETSLAAAKFNLQVVTAKLPIQKKNSKEAA
jgi:hypothetical protein